MQSSPKIGQNNLINICLKVFEGSIVLSFKKAITESLSKLFEQAENAASNQQEVTLFEQYNLLKKNSGKVLDTLSVVIKNMPDEITEKISANQDEDVQLSLVEDEVLEISLALTQLESFLDVRFSKYLYALEKRLKILFASKKISKDNMPFGVTSICWILSQTFESSSSDVKTKVLLIEKLKQQLGVELLNSYQKIDKIFVEAGILPNIKVEFNLNNRKSKAPNNQLNQQENKQFSSDQSQASSNYQRDAERLMQPGNVNQQTQQNKHLNSNWSQTSDNQHSDAERFNQPGQTNQQSQNNDLNLQNQQNTSGSNEGLSSQFGRKNSNNVVNSIFDLMNQGRLNTGQQNQQHLSNIDNNVMDQTLQNLSKVTSVAAGSTEIDKLKEMILDEVRNQTGIFYPGLNKSQQNSLDVMGMFYDHVKSDNTIDSNIVSSLNAINIPILRTAMSDKNFFEEENHPARQYLEKIIYAAQKWHGTQVVNKLHQFSSHLANDYDGSNESFKSANDDLEGFLNLTEARAKNSEEKWVKSVKGKEKLDFSRMKVESIVEEVSNIAQPEFVKNIIKHVFQDALTLSLLRHGEGSKEWKKNKDMSRTIAKMANSAEIKTITPKQQIESLHYLDQTMDDLGFSENDRKMTIQNVKECAESAKLNKLTKDIDLSHVSSINKKTVKFDRSSSTKIEEKRELTSTEKSQLTKIKLTPYGTLFDFILNQQRDKIRRRLSWFSPVSNKALFVSLLGNQPYERSLDSLAIDLARNNIVIVKLEEKKYFNQVMKDIFSKLKGMVSIN